MIIFSLPSSAQNLAIKNNLLYDAALTPNLGLEFRVAPHATMGVNAGLNAWDLNTAKGRKWRHVMVSPYTRMWVDSVYHRHFVSLYGVYSHYNAGNIHLPFGIYKSLRHERRQGDLYTAGLSYGYHWPLDKLGRWRMEAEVGASVGWTKYDRFQCGKCGTAIGQDDKFIVLPKLALNIGYYFGRRRDAKKPEVVTPITPIETITPVEDVQIEPVEETPEVPTVQPVVPEPEQLEVVSVAEQLRKTNPLLVPISEYQAYDRTMVMRKRPNAIYVDFPLNRSTLLYDFSENGPKLDTIISATRQIMADTLSEIRIMQIVGLASVEGGVLHNEQLAMRRAIALKDYIQKQVAIPDSLFEVNGGGEAWADLRDQLQETLNNGSYANKEEIRQAIRIINTEADPNRREQRIKQIGKGNLFSYIRTSLLPAQRNSGYLRIYYENIEN